MRTAVVVAAVIVLCACSNDVDTRADSYKYGDDVSAYYDAETKTLTITGSGEMYDFTGGNSSCKIINDPIENVVFTGEVTSIGEYVFESCTRITNVTISSTVTSIKERAFNGCTGLTHIDIPYGVESIGYEAFYCCGNVASVNLSSTVVSIGQYAFLIGSNLVSFDVDDNNPVFTSVDGVLYNRTDMSLFSYPCGKNNTYDIPDGTTAILLDAFRACSNLESVTIPSTVTSIGEYAFTMCENLASITIPASVTAIEVNAFWSTGVETVIYLGLTDPDHSEYSFADPRPTTVCVSIDYQGDSFCDMAVYQKNDTFKDIHNNHCYEYFVCGESISDVTALQRANASEWESHTNACSEYVCDNETGPRRTDLCASNNTKCYNYECQEDGTCSSSSTYHGNSSGCVADVVCDDNEGWKETAKNCTAIILADSETPSSVNEKTASCYDFECGDGGKCTYTAHKECGKVCDKEAMKECETNASTMECMKGTCTEEVMNNVWGKKCVYEKKEGWHDLTGNQCYEIACENNEWVIKNKHNEKDNECYEFNCDNKTGLMVKNKCVINGANMICVDDKCVSNETLKEEGIPVVISLSGVAIGQFDKTDFLSTLSKQTGVDMKNMKASVEYDEHGNVAQVTVVIADEQAAHKIENIVNECASGKTGRDDETKCEGILKYVKSAQVVENNIPGAAAHVQSVMMLSMIMSFFVAFFSL